MLKSKWLELSERECATAAAPSVLVTDHDHAQSQLALENFMVRNFVLNPLQVLQSWEKTMSVDCYTRGQGPMQLASLIVQTLPLDGDCHSASEEVSDPNCGEAAIGRVAPVDSGILLLRAYGKSTGRPLQIQALSYSALQCAREMLINTGGLCN